MEEVKKKNIFARVGEKIADTFKWLFDFKDWKKLLRSIPGLVTSLFIVSVIVMNLMAAKTVVMTNPSWLGITGGLFLSWIPFLCMDIIVKTYGAKAATKLNLLGLIVNLACVGIFQIISMFQIGGDPSTYAAFNATFAQTWQILIASSIAFVISGIANNFINAAIGKAFRKNPDGKGAYVTRTYVSTAVGQFIDNFIFTGLAFLVFFKVSIGTTLGWTIWTVLGTAAFGAILELIMEVIFSPLGYSLCKKWRADGVGKDYLEYCQKMELKEDTRRLKVNTVNEEEVEETQDVE